MTIEHIHDLADAQHLWKHFSPNASLWDDWAFRSSVASHLKNPIDFVVAREHDAPIGLLASQKNIETGAYEFFGGSFMEDNRVFTAPGREDVLPALFAAVPAPAKIEYLIGDAPFITALPVMEQKFTASLIGLADTDAFLAQQFSGKTLSTMRRKMEKVKAFGIEVVTGRREDLETMIALNMQRHGEGSTFHRPHRRTMYRDLLDLPTGQTILSSYLVGGVLSAVTFCIRYKETLVYLNAGVDVDAVPDLGAYVILADIGAAIAAGATRYDACIGSYSWKERWHLQQAPQRAYKKE